MENKDYNIYIGYDWEQDVAYEMCKRSIEQFSSVETTIHKINCNTVPGYSREFDPLSSTPFTYARFYVPVINNFKGFSLFCDGDFLFLEDVKNLFDVFDPKYAIQVVKHDYAPTNTIKMNNKIQTVYPKKNWSSLILWNNEHPKNKQLTLELLNKETGRFLHQFKWLEDNEIGSISLEWNWLVGWYHENEFQKPKALHFTEGGPWLKPAENMYDEAWLEFKKSTKL